MRNEEIKDEEMVEEKLSEIIYCPLLINEYSEDEVLDEETKSKIIQILV